MVTLNEIKESFLHLIFPHICCGCGNDVLSADTVLCARCLDALPQTNFHLHINNPVEKIFWGRLPLHAATAQYYFTKASLVQHLMHQLKYKGNRELGRQLGRLIGRSLTDTNRFRSCDALVPLPLFPAREKSRGYNQAALLCEGIGEVMSLPVLRDVVSRIEHTETQTRKGRLERWKNIEGKFRVTSPGKINGRHLLLVDDVITTGATLEACGLVLMDTTDINLSVATLCFASE